MKEGAMRTTLMFVCALTLGAEDLSAAAAMEADSAAVALAKAEQVLSGSLIVEVHDPSGAAVPGADVTITQVETNLSRTAVTNETGIATVPLGTFTVRVALSGFNEAVTTNVRVAQDNITRLRTDLTVGQLTDTVTVTAGAAVLQTDRADVRTEITSTQLQNLPVPLGR